MTACSRSACRILGAVLAGAGADGGAVLVPVARPSPARSCAWPERRRDMREGKGRTGAVPARPAGPAATKSARWRVALSRIRRARCGRAWTRSSASPPMSRTRSRTRSLDPQRDRDAAPDRGPGAAAPAARDHRRGRVAARPADQRYQRRLAGGCGAVARRRPSRSTSRRSSPRWPEIHEATRTRGRPALVLDAPAEGARGAGGRGPAGAGAAQPDRQRANPSARRDGRICAARARDRQHGRDQRRGRRARHPRGASSSTSSTASIRNARRASGSASIPASASRSAARSSRR